MDDTGFPRAALGLLQAVSVSYLRCPQLDTHQANHRNDVSSYLPVNYETPFSPIFIYNDHGRIQASVVMNTSIQIYNDIVTKVTFFFKQLKLNIKPSSTGRPLSINPIETISLSLFKQSQGIPTKKAIWNIFRPRCSYKTLVVNLNRFVRAAGT